MHIPPWYWFSFDAHQYLHRFFDIPITLRHPDLEAFILHATKSISTHPAPLNDSPTLDNLLKQTSFARDHARLEIGAVIKLISAYSHREMFSLRHVDRLTKRVAFSLEFLPGCSTTAVLALTQVALILDTHALTYQRILDGSATEQDLVDTFQDVLEDQHDPWLIPIVHGTAAAIAHYLPANQDQMSKPHLPRQHPGRYQYSAQLREQYDNKSTSGPDRTFAERTIAQMSRVMNLQIGEQSHIYDAMRAAELLLPSSEA